MLEKECLFYASFGAFLLLPPVLLAVRFLRPKQLPWWGVGLFLAVGGWLLVNAGVHFYYEHLAELVRARPSVDPALVDRLSSDGAKRVFAFAFGWLYGPVYSIPFLLLFAAASRWRERSSGGARHA